jgi:hypothetical protein
MDQDVPANWQLGRFVDADSQAAGGLVERLAE